MAKDLPDHAVPASELRGVGLTYVSDLDPGIGRRNCGHRFSYFDADGQAIVDETTLDRIRGLAIPPAWTNVWIAPTERGHIQATGRDARGR